MMNPHIPVADLEACQMDAESHGYPVVYLCQGKAFDSFTGLYMWFIAGLPDLDRIGEFWDEVEDLGW